MGQVILVALGGAMGSAVRYLTVGWAARWSGEIAVGTLLVNVFGSVLMGALAVVLVERMGEAGARYVPLVLTGFLGGFTTFSAFSLDAYRLFESGRIAAAAGYVAASVILAISGLVIGMMVARWALP